MFEVTVADDVLTAQPDAIREFPGVFSGWLGDVLFLVSPHPPTDPDNIPLLAESAQAAAHRFWLVSTQGVELPGVWATSDDLLPDLVFDPRRCEDGIVLGAYMYDGLWPAMATTMLRILLGELHSRKASAHVACPPAGTDVRNLPIWPTVDESPTPAPPRTQDYSQKCWFVRRTVRCVTTTGVPYTELEWLRPDRTWSRDRTAALTFENTSGSVREVGEFVARLREETGADEDPRLGNVHGVLLSPEQDPSVPLPPDAIRDHGHVWRTPAAGE